LLEPDDCIHDLVWKSSSAQDLRDERIGIKRDGSDEPVEFIRSERCILLPRTGADAVCAVCAPASTGTVVNTRRKLINVETTCRRRIMVS
jgi:hypothetical protein